MLNEIRKAPCPTCRSPLHFPESVSQNSLDVQCPHCRYKFSLIYGEVLDSQLRDSPAFIKESSDSKPPVLHVAIGTRSRGIREFSFEMQNHSRIPCVRGDDVVAFTTSVWNRQELAMIVNLDNGRHHLIFNPLSNAILGAIKIGGLVLVAGLLASTILSGVASKVAYHAALPSAIAATAITIDKRRIKGHERRGATRLVAEQRLLSLQYEVGENVASLDSELRSHQQMVGRLQQLKRNMLSLEDVYAGRVADVERAIATLEQQVKLCQDIRSGYDRVYRMLSIEFETSQLAEQLPDDIEAKILGRMEELKRLEELKAELALRVDPKKLLEMA